MESFAVKIPSISIRVKTCNSSKNHF